VPRSVAVNFDEFSARNRERRFASRFNSERSELVHEQSVKVEHVDSQRGQSATLDALLRN